MKPEEMILLSLLTSVDVWAGGRVGGLAVGREAGEIETANSVEMGF